MTATNTTELATAYDLASETLVGRALELAARLVGRDRIHGLSTGAFAVMFGATDRQGLSLAGPGLVELRIEPTRPSLRAVVGGEAPQLRCSPRAYSLGTDATLDSCEAQGAALVAAAQFGRTLLALLT